MKKAIHLIVSGILPLFCMAQIPNPDFELWQSTIKNQPQGWGIYGNTFKVQGYNSPFAVRIERDPQQPNAPGAVIYGNPDQNFTGGIPYNDRPDSVVVFVKRHLPAGDSAWFIVAMSRNGKSITNNNFKFTGSDSNRFVRLAFAIEYNDTGMADSLVIGISSTDPNSNFEGSFVIADSLHFTGGKGIKIPNGNFELWNSRTIDNPIGWYTSNNNGQSGGTLPVTKTSDAALHQFAIRIQNVLVGTEYKQGYIMAGRQGNSGPLPGFAVSGKDSLLYAYYKCFPKGGDVTNIGVMMFDSGLIVGTGFLRQSLNITTWSQTPIKIDYFSGYSGTPDSAVIFCSAFNGGDDAKGESVLYVDGLKFNEPLVGVSKLFATDGLLELYPNPCQSVFTISIPSYLQQEIVIRIYNSQGQLIQLMPLTQSSNGRQLIDIQTDGMSKGLYTVVLSIGNYSTSKTLVVE